MPRGIPGPHPGTTPFKKRKHEDDLSENPYTRKSRARTARLTGHDRTMDNARNADRQAVNRRLRKIKGGAEYIAADEAVRKRMLSEAVRKEMEYRDSIGRSAKVIAEKIGYCDSAGTTTVKRQRISKDDPAAKSTDEMMVPIHVVTTCQRCAGSAKVLSKSVPSTNDKAEPPRCADSAKGPDQPAPTAKKAESVPRRSEQRDEENQKHNDDDQQPWSWDSWSMFWKTAITPIFSKAKRLSRVGVVGAE